MPPQLITEFAPAKVNLTLHVTGQRGDGYHLLDSLVVFCGIGDRVTAQPSAALGLTVTGPWRHKLTTGGDNMVLQAARALHPHLGAALTLDKHLPLASGIGGGSSDAAATLRALSRLWTVPLPDAAIALALGADVPVCIAGHPARMRGVGERIDMVTGLPGVHIVLVNPGFEMPTPAVFKALATRQNPPTADTLPDWPNARALADWLKTQRNDLERPALAIAPAIGDVLAALAAQPGALMARMSGSGATCFALFETSTAAKAAADAIGAAQPKWWAASGPVYSGNCDPAQLIRATT